MAEHQDREHYIPLRKSDLLELLSSDRGMKPEDADQLRQLSRLLSATFHFEYHQKLEQLKDEYAPFNPDSTTFPIKKINPTDRDRLLGKLFDQFVWLMERANFIKLDRNVVEQAMNEVSDWGLNMSVDWSVFERLELFARGDNENMRYRRRWWNLYRLESKKLPVYQRLVVIAKLKPDARLPETVNTEAVFLKIFKDIPKMDLEMLLPGARMQMPGFTRLKMGGSFVSGLGMIGYSVFKQLLATAALGLYFFWGILFALFGYGYRQYYGYQSAKTAFSLQLTRSLYYQNLDNNAGVLFHLLDEAEEQECREALLGYYYLWRFANQEGWTAASLDDYIEMDLERLANLKVDFEIADALAKLERLGLVQKEGGRYRAVPIDKALEALDYAWDNYFRYNKA